MDFLLTNVFLKKQKRAVQNHFEQPFYKNYTKTNISPILPL